jgi:hypothetical protein
MKNRVARIVARMVLGIATATMGNVSTFAQNVLNAVFTAAPITVDGLAEAAWQNAPPQNIAICMNPTLTQQLTGCKVSSTVQAPDGSGSGGATPYRYDSFGNVPFRSAPFGNVYPWGRSTGAETMGDHVRHQTHNSNEMVRRFLNDIVPAAVEPRMYQTDTWGYGERLPYDLCLAKMSSEQNRVRS